MKIKFLRETAQLPSRGSEYAAGHDLYAALDKNECRMIPPHTTSLIPIGIAIEIPNGYWGGIYARSGLATKQGLRPANCVGVIDSDYRGEIFVALHNDSNEDRYINCGDRIAQLVLHPVVEYSWEISKELESTQRGSDGFGSTGK